MTPRHSITLTDDGKRIILRVSYSQKFLEFVHTLPDAKWDRKAKQWSCLATPATGYRLWVYLQEQDSAVIDKQVVDLAEGFADALKRLDHLPHYRIESKTLPWKHQVQAMQHAAHPGSPASMFEMRMGTGKSKAVVDLVHSWQCRRVLILCPLSVCQVWRREFHLHSASLPMMVILDKGSTNNKTNEAATACALCRDTCVIVINYESARSDAFAVWSLTVPWDLVVSDESHRIKAHNSTISKYVARLGRVAARRLCLSGTPANTPLDLFGQLRFLDPGILGTSWFQFRNRYAICGNPYIPQQVTGYQNLDELQERYRWITYQCGADVLDLPPVQHHERTFELSAAARKAYTGIEEELIADVGAGIVTAANALVRLLRLQQITSGFTVLDDTGEEHVVDVGKFALLIEFLTDLDPAEQVVVFCRFRHDLRAVHAAVGEANKQGDCNRTSGELSGSRKDLVDGRLPENVNVLAAQIQAGGLGVDLSAARYCVYYSLGFSLLEYEQSLARLHRPGQTGTIHYYHLIAEETVDKYLYQVLAKRKDVIDELLNLYRKDPENVTV